MTLFIGVTGTFCGGKDTVVELASKHFKVFACSTSDELRFEAEKRNLPQVRQTWRDLAIEIRSKIGAGELARRAAKRLIDECKKNDVEVGFITAIRSIGEVESLKKSLPGFVLLAIDADIKIRYRRAQSRKRGEEEKMSFEEFEKDQEKELKPSVEGGQDISGCMKIADFKLENNGTLEEFDEKALLLIKKLLEKK